MNRKEIVRIAETYVSGDVYLPADLDGGRGSAYEIPATGEEIERWTAAVKLWRRAQEEMRERFKEAEQIADAVYDVEASLRHEEYLKREQEQQHQRAAEETLGDDVDGPREWVVLRVGVGSSVRYTVHHIGCSTLLATLHRREEGGDEGLMMQHLRAQESQRLLQEAVRLPEIADKVSRETWPRRVPCGRCAGKVRQRVAELRSSSN